MARDFGYPALVMVPVLLGAAFLAVLLVDLSFLLQVAVVAGAGLVLVASLAFPYPTRASTLRLRVRQLLLLVVVITLPMIRWSGPGNTAFADAALLAAMLFGLAMLARKSSALPPRAPLYWWLFYLLAGILTTAGSLEPTRSLLTLAQDLFLLLFWVALYPLLYDETEELKISSLVRVWLAVAVVNGLLVLAGPFAQGAFRDQLTFGGWGGRGIGLFRDPNMAAHYLGLSLLLAPLARIPLRGPRLPIFGGGMLVLLLGLAATGSNGAKFALSAGVMAMLVAGLLRRSGRSIGVRGFVISASAFVALLTVLLFADVVLRPQQGPGGRDWVDAPAVLRLDRISLTLEQRIGAWQQTLRSFRDQPLGLGPGILGRSTLVHADREAHSDAFATLAERGLPGLLAFLGFAWAWVRHLGRNTVDSGDVGQDGGELVALAPIGATAFLLVFGLSIDTLHFRHLWFALAFILPAWKGALAPGEEQRLPS